MNTFAKYNNFENLCGNLRLELHVQQKSLASVLKVGAKVKLQLLIATITVSVRELSSYCTLEDEM